MGVFSRLSDIINANILNMLDKAEDPEKMVRLMIQEMEDTLIEVKSSAAKIISDQKGLERQIESALSEETSWQEKAELAVSKDRDDLARGALAEKSKIGEYRQGLEQRLSESKSSLDVFRSDINELENKLTDARNRQKSIIMRKRTVQSQLEIHTRIQESASGRAFDRFEQYERDLDRLEGKVEIFRNSSGTPSLSEEIDKLKKDSEIEDALQSLKKKAGKVTKANPEQK